MSPAKPMHHHGQDCLRLRVDVVGNKGSGKSHPDKSNKEEVGKRQDGDKVKFPTTGGGGHNPSNQLPAGEDSDINCQTDVNSPSGAALAALAALALVSALDSDTDSVSSCFLR